MSDSVLLPGVIVSLLISAMGWLVLRAIAGVDKKLAELSVKVDTLGLKDSQHSESIVELRVRMETVERELLYNQRSIHRLRREGSEEPP